MREREALRQEILDAARELFVKEGYEHVSMRKIAEKIEYSPTTIYLYFKDKAELLFSLCEETFSRLVDRFETLDQEHDDPLERLRKGLRAYVEFGLQYPNHYKVTFINHVDHELHDPDDSMGGRAYSNLSTLVAECIEQGKFRQMNAELVSQALWSAVHGVTSLLIVHKRFHWTDPDQLIDHLIDTMIYGLSAPEPLPRNLTTLIS